MVLLIPDAVRKIKAQGRAEGYIEGYVEVRVAAWAQGRPEDEQKARQLLVDAVEEYCRRKGNGKKEPTQIPFPVVIRIIDKTIPRNTTAPQR